MADNYDRKIELKTFLFYDVVYVEIWFFLCKNLLIIDLTTLLAEKILLDNEKRMQKIDLNYDEKSCYVTDKNMKKFVFPNILLTHDFF
jgi:hypothetical protein